MSHSVETIRYRVFAWDEQSDNKLKDLRLKGYGWSRIAEIMGNPSSDSVRKRYGRIAPCDPVGPRPPTGTYWTPEEDVKLKQLWADGFTCGQIAREMGRSKNAVVGRKERLGLPQRERIAKAKHQNLSHVPRRINRQTRNDGKPYAPKVASFSDVDQRVANLKSVGFPGGGVTWEELHPHGCRAIKGEPKGEHRWCGAQSQPGYSWCPEHKALFYRREE